MKKHKWVAFLMVAVMIISMILPAVTSDAAVTTDNNGISTEANGLVTANGIQFDTKITPDEREAAAERLQSTLAEAGPNALVTAADYEIGPDGYMIPDYFGAPNWAYSPLLTKFVDKLPGFGPANANALGQYIPVAVPDKTTYPGSDYYEIAIVEYEEQMHSDLPPTTNRGYVQISTSVVPGKNYQLKYLDGTGIMKSDGTPTGMTPALAVDKPHYLGPAIITDSGRPVRIKYYNLLPTGEDGDLFIPVDTSIMGAGSGTMTMMGEELNMNFTQNRANIHLHGNNTVWISDGTPHQWITPARENTPYPQGVSVVEVPDMNPASVNSKTDGATTLYYTNTQSARLMFYHDHSYGITRLNVYAGEAAPYIIRDTVEKDLINGTNVSGVNPGGVKIPSGKYEIPLVIQDRTFVDATTILQDDPTWAWGTEKYTPGTPYVPTTGDLWYPHVYSPAQNPWAVDGVNPFGRWMYGPWFWPPTSEIAFTPIPNPYHDPLNPDIQPPLMPATPNPSAPGESFMDTPIINGTAYPYMEVEPTAYRFRVLNAANDRFFNLQFYVADPTGYVNPDNGYGTEVKMVPSTPDVALPSHREQIMPDPTLQGPDWIQIGTEGGFLPAPVVIPSQPISWNLGLTAFNAGNIDQHSLLVGTAERMDVIVDFSQYAGQTLILYNDAPAPFPASDPRYDYYTNNPDQTAEGGSPSTEPGKGPNIRTVMQIRVAAVAPSAPYDVPALESVFAKTAGKNGVFETSQERIIIPQAAYNSAYGVDNLPSLASIAYIQQDEFVKTFKPLAEDGTLLPDVTLNIEPKSMQDEMGEVYDEYGRMSGFLGITSPITTSVVAPFIPYGFASPPVELFKGIEDLDATQIGSLDDGTQIWKITHNGVDTHTIHVHLFSAQLVNRVAWDGAMIPPDANELGWKETFRVNPLEHTVLAMRPKVPAASTIPFAVPNSIRLIDPTMPEGAVLVEPPPAGWFDPQGNSMGEILNHKVNFGWEYVYHCHILSHEEMDMMHSMAVAVKPKTPTNLTVVRTGNGGTRRNVLNWLDNSSNETSFSVERAINPSGPWTTLASLPTNVKTYTNVIGNSNTTYYYRVLAINTIGDTQTPGFPSVTQISLASNVVLAGTAQTNLPSTPNTLTATLQQGPQVLLSWNDTSTTESGFVIERSTNGGTYAALLTVGPRTSTGTVSYTDTTVAPGTTYMYRVAAVNSAGMSGYSNIANATTPAAVVLPSAPSQLNATGSTQGNRFAVVKLTWNDLSNNETGFIIERSTNAAFTANLDSTTVAANSTIYTTPRISRNTPYYFRIRAINATGQSAWSNATPFPILTP